ncbi:MAG: acyl-CoA dehydrogenase family protein, partial [Thermoplasmata archaeon]|nr:acyl-CoA dehydrogenase family protein [Thermoplasmata archaeon]
MPTGVARSAEEWRLRARHCALEVVRPVAAQMDAEDRLPEGIVPAIRAGGFLGVGVPESWGGSGGDTRATVAVLEEFSAESAAVATLIAVHLSVAAMPILQWGTDAQRAKYLRPLAEGPWLGAFGLTEPGAGSDTARLACRYERVDDRYRLNGSKMFITNAASADVVLVFATRDPSLGHRGISAFIVRKGTEGYRVAQHMDKLGLRGSETTELVFQDMMLGPDTMLGPEGRG